MVPNLPAKPHKPLSKEQQAAFERMRSLLMDRKGADDRYNAIQETKSGQIISTDFARFLDDRYAKEPKAGGLRDLEPSWDLAWRYAQNRLERELAQRRTRKKVRFMAGGWAAGKTFALRNEPTTVPDLVWDGTLSDQPWAAGMIEAAQANGWQVEVVYVFRDLELALYSAMERKREEGRGVPVLQLPNIHRGVQKSILGLTALFRSDPSVSFIYLHNLGTKAIPARQSPQIDLIDLEVNGALHYLQRHEEYYQKAIKSLKEV